MCCPSGHQALQPALQSDGSWQSMDTEHPRSDALSRHVPQVHPLRIEYLNHKALILYEHQKALARGSRCSHPTCRVVPFLIDQIQHCAHRPQADMPILKVWYSAQSDKSFVLHQSVRLLLFFFAVTMRDGGMHLAPSQRENCCIATITCTVPCQNAFVRESHKVALE